MLGSFTPVPTIAVKDLSAAKNFYEKKLNLSPVGESDEFVQNYKCGDGLIEVYKSDFAGTNKSTAVTFEVKDINEEVETLKKRGIEFEHYEMPGTTLEGDIHVMKDMKAAWFKDLDGNILCLHQ